MIKVKATREGLLGKQMASGLPVSDRVPFVALPSVGALYRFVRLTNPLNNLSTLAIVLDVGPWNIKDEDYVFKGMRPQAESGVDHSGRMTNHAGIDLGEKVWKTLKMEGNTEVEWEFIS